MNERIRELQIQADTYAHNRMAEIGGSYLEYHSEKFAELIVRECADYADMAQDADCKYAGDYVAEAMGYGEEEGVTEWRTK